jgi:hypothetical protein
MNDGSEALTLRKYPVALADVPNHNGRTYPKAVLDSACEQVQGRIKAGVMTVHLGPTAQLQNMVGIVNKLEMDGPKLVAQVEFPAYLNAESTTIESLIHSGRAYLALSGVGTLKENVVQADYVCDALVIGIHNPENTNEQKAKPTAAAADPAELQERQRPDDQIAGQHDHR